jgi:hypothetical protein
MKYALLILAFTTAALAAPPAFAPDRKEGEGPWTRLIIRGVTLVDGTGAPPIGPVDIVIEGNRIREVRSVGFPKVPIKPESRPKDAVKEIDGTGIWVLPGFVDMHGHSGGAEQGTTAEYVGTGWMRVNDTTGNVDHIGGIKYVMKDGILYDAKKLLHDVEVIVQKAKAAEVKK